MEQHTANLVPAKGSVSITEEEEERMEETQEFCKMLSSAQDMVIVLTHSQQLWLPTRDQATYLDVNNKMWQKIHKLMETKYHTAGSKLRQERNQEEKFQNS